MIEVFLMVLPYIIFVIVSAIAHRWIDKKDYPHRYSCDRCSFSAKSNFEDGFNRVVNNHKLRHQAEDGFVQGNENG